MKEDKMEHGLTHFDGDGKAVISVAVEVPTIYDISKEMVIGAIQLERNEGGKSGTFLRSGI